MLGNLFLRWAKHSAMRGIVILANIYCAFNPYKGYDKTTAYLIWIKLKGLFKTTWRQYALKEDKKCEAISKNEDVS